jgi:hypothetical protein
MKSISLLMSNTDNKLSQQQWHDFIAASKQAVRSACAEFHFFGAPPNWERHQNAAFVFTLEDESIHTLKEKMKSIRSEYNQDSVAWLEGDTVFL